MKSKLFFAAVMSLLTVGCDMFSPATGSWELEVEDADRCTVDMDIEQAGDELSGEADVSCRIFFNYDGEVYYYDMEQRGVYIEGDYDEGDIELEMRFYDDFLADNIEVIIEGELEDGEFEGELLLEGDLFGDVSGNVEP